MVNLIGILIVLLMSTACNGQRESVISIHGTLPQALLTVDQTFHVSVLGELVDPVPTDISAKIKIAKGPSAAMAAIMAKCPGYVWFKRNKAFVVVQKRLLKDPANPMNQVVPTYQVPSNLSSFRLSFPSAVGAAKQNVSGVGGLINGFGLPETLSPPLTVQVLHNMTAREILLRVAEEVGNLYSILILPNTHPVVAGRSDSDFLGWEIAGGPGINHYKPYLERYP